MTVKEMIEILQKYPPELEVYGSDVAGNNRPITIFKSDWMKDENEPEYVIIDAD